MVSSPVYLGNNPRKAQRKPASPCPLPARRILLTVKSFRINTSTSLSKHTTLTVFRINTYAEMGVGVIIVN
jgi:hypothetical protein